jgi:hypothetical protein
MASLFDHNFKYTERAESLSKELRVLLQPIYQELLEEGYSPREITVLITNMATKTENALVMEWEETQAYNHKA